MSPRLRGFLIGGAVAVATCVDVWVAAYVDHRHDYTTPTPLWLNVLWWSIPAVVLVGYVAGVVLTVRRSTRKFGLFTLVGLTVVLPIAFYATVGILYRGGLIFENG